MRIACPCCSSEFPIEAGFADAEGKRLAVAFAELEPPVARALMAYLRLHKPRKTVLRQSRALKLAQEVAALIASGEIASEGRVRRATPAMWAQAMDDMASNREKLRLPLDGHGYLVKVVAGLADEAEAAAERRSEEDKRLGRHRAAAPTPGAEDVITNAQRYADRMVDLAGWSPEQREAYIADARKKAGMP